MAKTNSRRRQKERFVGVPYRVFKSEQYKNLSNPAARILWELAGQLNGGNNGNLTACGSIMAKRNISEGSRYRGLKELLKKGFVIITRQGWKQRGRPTLLALTWLGIDEVIGAQYDDDIKPSPVPLNCWRNNNK